MCLILTFTLWRTARSEGPPLMHFGRFPNLRRFKMWANQIRIQRRFLPRTLPTLGFRVEERNAWGGMCIGGELDKNAKNSPSPLPEGTEEGQWQLEGV